jgi:type II secretory ATPase GspE/PulE/Tfp pilus assembly ATPase PilB-like protein
MDLRVATLPTTFGEKVVLRLLDNADPHADLRGLGFFPKMLRSYEKVFRRPYGTVLVTDPTGSVKSTTLYANLGELNSAPTGGVSLAYRGTSMRPWVARGARAPVTLGGSVCTRSCS